MPVRARAASAMLLAWSCAASSRLLRSP